MVDSPFLYRPVFNRVRNNPTVKNIFRKVDRGIHHNIAGRLRATEDSRPAEVAYKRKGGDTPSNGDIAALLHGEKIPWQSQNPVITAKEISDFGAVNYVADPFLVEFRENWRLYYEIFNLDTNPTAVIGCSSSDDRGKTWEYEGICLNPGCHVSFPFVFERNDVLWMVPNLDPIDDDGEVKLYKSENGDSFEEHATIAQVEETPTDRIVFQFDGRWWLFVATSGEKQRLQIYYSDSIEREQWEPHCRNPVQVNEPRIPGGSPIVFDDSIIAFFQNGPRYYGETVEAYEINRLSPSEYSDRKINSSPIIGPDQSRLGWSSGRMHTFDAQFLEGEWVCAIDGDTDLGQSVVGPNWSVGLCTVAEKD